jgi:hypothetical protein
MVPREPKVSDDPKPFEAPEEVQTFVEQLSLTNQALVHVSKALGLGVTETALLNKAIQGFRKAFDEADKMQGKTLAINKTLADVTSQASIDLAKLPLSLAQAIETQFEFMEAGLTQAGAQSLNLASAMKLTGSNIKALLNLNRDALAFGRLNQESLESLNKTIFEATRDSAVSFDRLIGSLNKLSNRMMILGALGLTKEVMEAQVKFIAKLGAGSDQLVATLFSQIFDPNAPMSVEIITGVFDLLQTMRQPGGMTPDNLEQLVSTLGGSFEGMRSMVDGLPIQIQDAILGPTVGGFGGMGGTAAALLQLSENVLEIDKTLNETRSQFDEQVSVFTNRVWKPMQIAFMKVFGVIIKFIGAFAPLISGLIVGMATQRIMLGLSNLSRAQLKASIFKLTAAIMGQNVMGNRMGMIGFMAGPIGIAAGIAAFAISAAMAPSMDEIAGSTASIDAKTPEPDRMTSMFADKTSMVIKESIAATIFMGSGMIEALNDGFDNVVGASTNLGEILLYEGRDTGVPGAPFR